MGSAKERSKLKHSSTKKAAKPQSRRPAFALCLRNDGCDDLQPRKAYQVFPDEVAAKEGYVRVIDESGEDYLYPADYFVLLTLPDAAARALT